MGRVDEIRKFQTARDAVCFVVVHVGPEINGVRPLKTGSVKESEEHGGVQMVGAVGRFDFEFEGFLRGCSLDSADVVVELRSEMP
ncbi:hypothetical protein Nepgr_027559 [Nepenthes gracilis]|uniref:Uncharacterized protein n=1 Tax=Nepenthes gracilis TaxID=150966 RepID=A0AAD3TBK4_NEPGR|nr:hypothetical protein Nepgr_027559 [Nepenthes gracilis]